VTLETTAAVARSALKAWDATLTGSARYWSGVIERGATPFDVAGDALEWWDAMTDRRRPDWSSPNEVVLETGFAALRDFSGNTRSRVVPTVVLPPQAGHHSCIVDYSRDQSQIATIKAAGLEHVYAFEWIGTTRETRETTITDYVDFLEQGIDTIGGGPVNLIGDCQGGWLAAIYAALHPEQINTLTLAGAPIDFHAGDGIIAEWVRALCRRGDISFYEAIVASSGGVMPGQRILEGFVAIRPENEIEKQLGLLTDLHDAKHRERYRAFEDWFKWTQDLPGMFYLWVVSELFRSNKLIAGDLWVKGQRLSLSDLKMPLFLLAGEDDHITPPAQVFAAADAVSTPKSKIVKRTTGGGHLGLFMGREALREQWPPILAGILEHSKASRPNKKAAAKSARRRTPTRGRKTIPAP
jgi:poly(3-hydroxyalkanoate) synthetase